jgi:hypothetical protein
MGILSERKKWGIETRKSVKWLKGAKHEDLKAVLVLWMV